MPAASSFLRLCLLSLTLCLHVGTGLAADQWKTLEPGLELGTFHNDKPSLFGSGEITVLRVDPKLWDLRLYSKQQFGYTSGLPTKEWSQRHNLVAAINAGMYLQDMSTHVGYMQAGEMHQGKRVSSYHSLAAFDPITPGLAPFRIFDLDEAGTDFDQIIRDYTQVVQNMRLIKRIGENRWGQQDKRWSGVALGEDKQGRALLIYSGDLLSMHDFNELLLSLPLDLITAQHLEGGKEAQLYINHPNYIKELNNNINRFYLGQDGNLGAWPIPNVIGVSKKDSAN
jgi:uncharacterized protein YigE (DUF2233 family)